MSQLVEHIDDFGRDTWWFTSEIKAITYAKCYLLLRGYHYTLSVQVKQGRNLSEIDEKIHRDYEITYDKSKAKRRRDKGRANVRMIRYSHNVLIMATHGVHQGFFANPQVVNIKEGWQFFGKHKFTLVESGKEKLNIRVTEGTFQTALDRILKQARGNKEELEQTIKNLTWYWSRQTLHQRFRIFQKVNRVRKSHKLSQLTYQNIRRESYEERMKRLKKSKQQTDKD